MDVSPEKPANEEPAKPDPSAPAPDASAPAPEAPPPRRRAAGVSLLGAATAVLGILLAVLGIASLVVSRDNGVSALDARLAGLELDPRELAGRNEETLAAARAALAELAQKLPDASAAVRSELEGLASRVTGVERGEKAVESGDRAVRLALAANALNAAVERGEPFATALATVKALGGDPKLVAALEPFAASGVPSAAALTREFSELALSLQTSAVPREGVLGKLQANAEKLVRIRRIDETPGSDAAAILARSEAKSSRGDISGALAEMAQLPPQAREPAEAWIKRAQAATAARDASRRLSAEALAGLGK